MKDMDDTNASPFTHIYPAAIRGLVEVWGGVHGSALGVEVDGDSSADEQARSSGDVDHDGAGGLASAGEVVHLGPGLLCVCGLTSQFGREVSSGDSGQHAISKPRGQFVGPFVDGLVRDADFLGR